MSNLIFPAKDEVRPAIGGVTNVVEFTNENFGNIRAVTISGEPYFCGNDVAKALGYAKPQNAVATHCPHALKQSIGVQTGEKSDGTPAFQNVEMCFIPESDIYRLIMKSKLPSAEKFEAWVCDEVLPSIRKTGGYVNNDDLFIKTYLPFADEGTRVLFLQTLKTVREQNEMIQKQQQEIQLQKQEIVHKEDVIIGLVDNIDLATKRQRITQIVRHCENKNYRERYSLLYKEFEKKYHCDLKYRTENDVLRPKAKNIMDYIDRGMDMIPQLYEIACKLFENDVEALKAEWDYIVA